MFVIFSVWVSKDALMLSGAGTFSRIVLVDSKIVFTLLGASISNSIGFV